MKLDRVIAVRNDKTVYRDDDRAVKVFVSGYSKTDVLNEALCQSQMEECGLSVPKLLEVSVIDGKWSIVSEYVRGKTLSELMALEPDRAALYMDLFVKIQTRINSTVCPGLSRITDKIARRIDESDLESKIKQRLSSSLHEMSTYNNVCHGDYDPSNVILDEDGLPHVIDWARASRGNPAADLAKTYILFLLKDDGKSARLYLDTVIKKTSADVKEIDKWIPYVAASEIAVRRGAAPEILYDLLNFESK